MNIERAPSLTARDRCSYCDAAAMICGDGEMKVCPKCFALLWHRDWSKEAAERAAARSAELTAQKLRLREENQRQAEERQRQAEERRAADAAFRAAFDRKPTESEQ